MFSLSLMSPEELREKYVTSKDELNVLKKHASKQEDKIKRLQTKLRKLMTDRKRDVIAGGRESGLAHLRSFDLEETVTCQNEAIQELQLTNEQLQRKLKLAQVQLSSARKNRSSMFHHVTSRVDSGLKRLRKSDQLVGRLNSSLSKVVESHATNTPMSSVDVVHNDQNQELSKEVRDILEEAREKILSMNEQLMDVEQAAVEMQDQLQHKVSSLEEEISQMREDLQDQGLREERDSVAVVRCQRELRSANGHSMALQEQLTATEGKLGSEKMKRENLQSEIERLLDKQRVLEEQLRGSQQENQKLRGQLSEITEKNQIFKRENEQYRTENDRLTTLTLFCDHRRDVTEVTSLKLQIAHLEATLQSDLSERGTLLERMTKDKDQLVKASADVQDLRAQNLCMKEELEKSQKKMEVFARASSIELSELEEAFTLIKQRKTDYITGSFGQETDEKSELLQKIGELQLLYHEKCHEMEKLSALVTSHADTYKGFQNQISKLNSELSERERSNATNLQNVQECVDRSNEKCRQLERQIVTLTDHRVKEKLEGEDFVPSLSVDGRQNVLEFHIERVAFEPAFDLAFEDDLKLAFKITSEAKISSIKAQSCQLKTFVAWTVPFNLEDPVQHTNVALGSDASFNHSSFYRLHMNNTDLTAIRCDPLHAGVYLLQESGHPFKVGECKLHLREILDHPRNTLHGTVPVVKAQDEGEEGEVMPHGFRQILAEEPIGTLSYWFRLLKPCEAMISQYLRNVDLLTGSASVAGYDAVPLEATTVIKDQVLNQSSTVKDKIKKISPIDEVIFFNKNERIHETPKPIPAPRQRRNGSVNTKKFDDSFGDQVDRNINDVSCHGSDQDNSQPQSNVLTRSNTFDKLPVNTDSSLSNEVAIGRDQSYNKTEKTYPKVEKGETSFDDSSESEIDSSLTPHVKIAVPDRVQRKKGMGDASGLIRQTKNRESGASSNTSTETSENTSEDQTDDTVSEPPASTSVHKVMTKQKKISESEVSSSESESQTSQSESVIGRKNYGNIYPPDNLAPVGPRFLTSPSSGVEKSDSEGMVMTRIKKADPSNIIYMEICSLTLSPDSPVVNDPSVQLLFVDYHGFLDLPPEQLETPQSLPKPTRGQSLNFNYGQEISMDERLFPGRKEMLLDLVHGKGGIKFTVTSEPLEHEQDSQDCRDLGYAFILLRDVLRHGVDLEEEELPVTDIEDGSQLGSLWVTLRIQNVLQGLCSFDKRQK